MLDAYMWQVACALGGVSGATACRWAFGRAQIRARRKRLASAHGHARSADEPLLAGGLHKVVLDRCVERSIDAQASTVALSMGVDALSQAATLAGLRHRVTMDGLVTVRVECAVLFAAAFALVGSLMSLQLAVTGALLGVFFGWGAVRRALVEEGKLRTRMLEGHLSEAIEVICLGLRSGLSFDRALALYCSCFETSLARQLSIAQGEWESGLRTREEALRALEQTYSSALLGRVVDGIVRSTRFGSPLADVLDRLAAESRAAHKASVEEAVMKAPVKMMVPVGTLILPSMLILVMGPVLLEFIG